MTCDSSKIGLSIFSYNRPEHLNTLYNTILSLEIDQRYCFHLFNDGPKISETPEIRMVQQLTENFAGKISNSSITKRVANFGLAKSIHLGLNLVFSNHQKAIILEDDIIPTKKFFEIMEYYLHVMETREEIGSVTGSNTTKFPAFERRDFLASKRHSSWGWATWADRWLSIDWNFVEQEFLQNEMLVHKVKKVSPDLVRFAKLQQSGQVDSWATTMNIDFIIRGLLCIVPRYNSVINIGLDGSGTHSINSKSIKNISEFLVEEEGHTEICPEVKKSRLYDFLVQRNNSLLSDFPKGTIFRLLIRTRSFILNR